MTWTVAQMRMGDGLKSLRWMQEAGWAGSLDVLVDTGIYTKRITEEWVMVREVRDRYVYGHVTTGVKDFYKPGRWGLGEIKGVRLNAAGIAEAEKLPEGCPFRNMAIRHKAAAGERVFAASPTEADRLAERLR